MPRYFGNLNGYLQIARVDHWIKNLFIVPGVIIGQLLLKTPLDRDLFIDLVVGFLATCFAASANYVINEWLDARFDKFHPTKKNRPVVVSDIKFRYVMVEYVLLVALSLALSLCIHAAFVAMILWLLLMGVLYNVEPIRTKDVPFLDVLSESLNNMIRLLLGWFVVTDIVIPPLSILLGYWMGGAFLMAVKRFAEFRMIGDPAQAGLYRKSFRHYTEETLLGSSLFYAMAATFLIGIFMIKYRIEYLLAMPLMFGLFCIYLHISFKVDSAVQKPEKLYKERRLMVYIAVFVASLIFLTYVDIPILDELFEGETLRRL